MPVEWVGFDLEGFGDAGLFDAVGAGVFLFDPVFFVDDVVEHVCE